MLRQWLNKIPKFIQSFLTSDVDLEDKESLRKVIVINSTGGVLLLTTLIWTFVDWFYLGRITNAMVDFVGVLIGLSVILGLRKSKNVALFSKAYMVVLTAVLFSLNFLLGISSSNTFWLFLIPAAGYFIAGDKMGAIFSALGWSWMAVFCMFGYLGWWGNYVDLEFTMDLLSAYLLVSLFMFFYERTRRRTEVSLKEAKDFSEDIIRQAPIGIYTVDAEGVIESMNPTMRSIAGGEEADERVGVNVFGLPAYRESGLVKILQRSINAGESFEEDDLEYSSRSTGETTIRRYRGIPLHNADGRVARVLLLVEDVTGMKEMEEAREDLIRELSRKNEELERFVYVVSHDLRSPLTSLRGYLDEIKMSMESGDDQQIEEDMDNIDQLANNMGLMIDDLLKMSRIGREEYEKEKVNFEELLRDILKNFEIQIEESDCEVEVLPSMPTLKVYRRPMEEIFGNLIGNALKFIRPHVNSRIEVGCEERQNEYHFFVRDNGVGISPENKRKLFNLFFRHGKKAGTGIGLSIVKEYVEMHNGKVWVDSEEGKGSTFWFSIPKE